MTWYAAMWSGGKDSALALQRARERGLAVPRLVNVSDPATGRVRFHGTSVATMTAQAAALGCELTAVATSWEAFDGSLRTALDALARDGCRGLVFGDIHLADVRAWYEERTRAAGLEHVEPLWGEDPRALLDEFVRLGGRAVVTCVERSKLGDEWLGRLIDERFAAEIAGLPIDACGENGEYHSFAVAGPMFVRPLAWRSGAVRADDRFAQLDVVAE